jgi:hypothetical protein
MYPMIGGSAGIPAGTMSQGAYEYGHAGAADTLTTAGTFYQLSNDGLGASTISTYGLTGLTNVFDTVTNRFVFSGDGVLSLGDTVHIVIEAYITTPSTNTEVTIVLELGAEGSGDYLIVMEETNFKSTGTYQISRAMNFFMRTNDILTNGARVLAKSDSNNTTILTDDYIVSVYHTN